ncbi:glycosyltransferase [Moritella sp. 5]|uniref:glycosyltransferase family 2 protein n=1 Tax=Moritella sp. 5 TaxID=2746231 RepID=UPI001BAE55A4|nr:glycosyltransferase [Moritella sp. 5]QUM79385.1 glycosyltransferase [Moritella sp. 5]
MSLSIVISTMGRPATLYRIIECLSRQDYPIENIIIIEASGFQWEMDVFPLQNIRVEYKKGLSLLGARKYGLSLTCSKYVAFLDDDIIIDNDYLSSAVGFLEGNYNYNGVGGTYEDNFTKNRSKLSTLIGKFFFIYGNGRSNSLISSGWADYVRLEHASKESDAEWLFGCNGVYRAEALNRLNNEEEMVKWSFLEDVILGAKLTNEYGITLRILPNLNVIHAPEETSGDYNIQTLRMRVLYRHLYFRNILQKRNIFKYCFSMLGNILLLGKSSISIDNFIEIAKVYSFLIVNWKKMDWDKVNEYIIKKD